VKDFPAEHDTVLPRSVRTNGLFYCFFLQKELCRSSHSHVPWVLTNLYILWIPPREWEPVE